REGGHEVPRDVVLRRERRAREASVAMPVCRVVAVEEGTGIRSIAALAEDDRGARVATVKNVEGVVTASARQACSGRGLLAFEHAALRERGALRRLDAERLARAVHADAKSRRCRSFERLRRHGDLAVLGMPTWRCRRTARAQNERRCGNHEYRTSSSHEIPS